MGAPQLVSHPRRNRLFTAVLGRLFKVRLNWYLLRCGVYFWRLVTLSPGELLLLVPDVLGEERGESTAVGISPVPGADSEVLETCSPSRTHRRNVKGVLLSVCHLLALHDSVHGLLLVVIPQVAWRRS